MSFTNQIKRIAGLIASAPPPATSIKVFPIETAGIPEIVRDRHYFSVTLNEMYLTKGREFWSTYDPLVFISASFVHGSEEITVPLVVGPSTLKGKQELPHGFVVNDVRLIGPHPFRGGLLRLTVVLYKSRTQDYAKRVLQFAEGISNAIGAPAEVALLSKVGGPLLDSFETLVSQGDCVPIAGHRIEIDGNSLDGLRPHYVALVAGNDSVTAKASVRAGRLLDEDQRSFRTDDYILYSIGKHERRDQESTLPFFDLVHELRTSTLSVDDESWSRAKATLIALYQKMLTSPDLTSEEADLLFDGYKAEMLSRRDRARAAMLMSANGAASVSSKLDRVVKELS